MKLLTHLPFLGTLMLLLGMSVGVQAHHDSEHRVLALGVPTELPLQLPVCDTEKQMAEVLAAYAQYGPSVGVRVLQRLNRELNENGQPKCSLEMMRVIVVEVVHRGIKVRFQRGEKPVDVVKFRAVSPDGEQVSELVFVGAITDMAIVADAEALDVSASF